MKDIQIILNSNALSIISAEILCFVFFMIAVSANIEDLTSFIVIKPLPRLLFHIISKKRERKQMTGRVRSASVLMLRKVRFLPVRSESMTLGSISIRTAVTQSFTTLLWAHSSKS